MPPALPLPAPIQTREHTPFVCRVKDDDDLISEASTSVVVINLPPDAADDQATTPKDTAITVDVLANDSDVPADPLTILSVGAPAHGTAAATANEQILYTPSAGYVGADSFVYTVGDDDSGAGVASVKITVTGGTPGDDRVFLPALQR